MLTSSELKKIPIFSCLNDANLMWLSQQAADLHLEPGEYLIHEGEPTPYPCIHAKQGTLGRQFECHSVGRAKFF
jgi:thioredoxin reductase (NADPH)